MDEHSYHKIFIANKDLVIELIRYMRELEASCDLLIQTDPEHREFPLRKMMVSLLDYKSAKNELLSKAFYGNNPNPCELKLAE